MKIISRGDRSKVEKEIIFTCPRCFCVFSMTTNECEEKIVKALDVRNETYDKKVYEAKCPEPFCGYEGIRGKEN